MNLLSSIIVVAALAGAFNIGSQGGLAAAEGSSLVTLKPMSGPGVGGSKKFLLSRQIGTKQTISYFQNEGGTCKLTLMVAEAFNGEDVPNVTTVRFQVAIGAGEVARMDTADGKSLAFACAAGAQELSISEGEQIAAYGSGT
jgi:hypothetical protein